MLGRSYGSTKATTFFPFYKEDYDLWDFDSSRLFYTLGKIYEAPFIIFFSNIALVDTCLEALNLTGV